MRSTLTTFVITALAFWASNALAGPVNSRQGYKNYDQLKDEFCQNGVDHCVFVNDNFVSDYLRAAAGARQAHHASDPVTLLVLKDGIQATYDGICYDNGAAGNVRLKFVLDNDQGHSVTLSYGHLNGYFTSDKAHKLEAGKIESHVRGDDLVLYCPSQ